MEEIVGLSAKERARLVELEQVKAGRQTVVAAAERLSMSGRQGKRIWKRYRAEGAKGLVHRARGRPSNRKLDPDSKRQSLELCRTRLEGFGPTLAAEKLAEVGLRVSHETLRRWLIVEGLWKKKRKRGPHRRWRPPKEHFGELVQMDGSFHDWLETGEKPCLIDMVDDGTSFMDGRFFEQETTEGAMRVLWGWIELYGIPRALYTDHKNLYVADREPTPDEQLAGRPALSAFGKACHKLGIQIIPGSQPSGQGEDREAARRAPGPARQGAAVTGYQGPRGGQRVSLQRVSPERQWQVRAQRGEPGRLPSPVPKGLRLEDVFVFEEERTVQNDWTVAWDNRWFQISGPKARMPRRRERIVVRRRLDGSRVLLHRGRDLEFHEIEQRPSRAKSARKPAPVTASRPVSVPPEDHPWRRPFTAAGAQATRERQLRVSNR